MREVTWQHRVQAGPASRVVEIAMPSYTAGWVVVGRSAHARDPRLPAQTVSSLHGANLGTLTIDLPHRHAPAAAWLRIVVAELRRDLAGDLPVAFLGAGTGAGVGWAAAAAGDLDGVMAVNGRPVTPWTRLARITAPSLLVVEHHGHDLPWELMVARTLSWRLGAAQVDLLSGRHPIDAGGLARWYVDHLLSPSAPRTLARTRSGALRGRAAQLGVAAALLAPALAIVGVAPASARSSLPNFAAASRLSSHQIGGDTASAGARTGAVKAAGDKRLTSEAIRGDAQPFVRPLTTGETGLIDGDGVEYKLNANITFSTTSSASGAMSDASLTHSVAASTLNGGTAQSKLNDAYDGYETLCIAVDNAVNAQCATGDANYVIYNKNGAPTADPTAGCTAEQVIFNPQTIDGVTVSREVFVPSNDGFGRWLDIVTNPGSSPATVTLQTANNLGSDSNTVITGDSTDPSETATPTTADTWVTSFQNFSGTTSSDLRLGHVFGGPGAATGLAGLFFANGSDRPYWGYTLTVAPGQTQIIANYGVTEASQAAANAKSAELASLSDAHQLDCMTPLQQAQVVNFKIAAQATADSFATQHDTALSEPAPGVLANDPNNQALTAQLVSGPAHAASFALNPDGSFAYTPAAGFAGTDSFTYSSVGEGGGTSPPTTVTLSVVGVAPAVTSAATADFRVGTPGSFTVSASGNPTPALTESGTLPQGLSFHDNGDGTATISGTPASGTHGNQALTITAANGQGADATAALTLAVAPGAVPTSIAHRYHARQGHRLVVRAPGLLRGDTGSAPLHVVLVSRPAHGTLKLSLNGALTYRPSKSSTATARFRYAVVDPDGQRSATRTVTVTVAGSSAQQLRRVRSHIAPILASYRHIATSTGMILVGRDPAVVAKVDPLLAQALRLATQAKRLEATGLRERTGSVALQTVRHARASALQARSLASQARIIAARARADGQ
jgi:Big-like domain-containing protein